jgi:hypothetical protein
MFEKSTNSPLAAHQSADRFASRPIADEEVPDPTMSKAMFNHPSTIEPD